MPDRECAKSIAHKIVREKLAACCNIVPGITSVYTWQDKINEDDELLLIIKSNSANFELLKETIISKHPYDVPEVISIDITEGSKDYLNWIDENVRK